MTLQELLEQYNGRYLDFDGKYGGQCVDLYRFYCAEVLHIPQSPPVVGAKDIWGSYLKEYFTAISNTPDGVPTEGDIVIWGNGTYGHVAIFIEGNVNRFKSFDQNMPLKSPCHVQEHTYSGVIGWLHPISNHPNQMIDEYSGLDLTNIETNRIAARAWKDLVSGKYVSKEEVEKLQEELRKAKQDLESESTANRVNQETTQAQVGLIAKDLGCSPDFPTIRGEISKLKSSEDYHSTLESANKKLLEQVNAIQKEADESSNSLVTLRGELNNLYEAIQSYLVIASRTPEAVLEALEEELRLCKELEVANYQLGDIKMATKVVVSEKGKLIVQDIKSILMGAALAALVPLGFAVAELLEEIHLIGDAWYIKAFAFALPVIANYIRKWVSRSQYIK